MASIGFAIGEYMFEQMSSVKSRKHYVLADMAFHFLWAFMFFIGFCYLTNQWSASAEPPIGYSSTSVKAAIVFCLFGTFSCVSRSNWWLILIDEFSSSRESPPTWPMSVIDWELMWRLSSRPEVRVVVVPDVVLPRMTWAPAMISTMKYPSQDPFEVSCN